LGISMVAHLFSILKWSRNWWTKSSEISKFWVVHFQTNPGPSWVVWQPQKTKSPTAVAARPPRLLPQWLVATVFCGSKEQDCSIRSWYPLVISSGKMLDENCKVLTCYDREVVLWRAQLLELIFDQPKKDKSHSQRIFCHRVSRVRILDWGSNQISPFPKPTRSQ
jgi:hypothetical protein